MHMASKQQIQTPLSKLMAPLTFFDQISCKTISQRPKKSPLAYIYIREIDTLEKSQQTSVRPNEFDLQKNDHMSFIQQCFGSVASILRWVYVFLCFLQCLLGPSNSIKMYRKTQLPGIGSMGERHSWNTIFDQNVKEIQAFWKKLISYYYTRLR